MYFRLPRQGQVEGTRTLHTPRRKAAHQVSRSQAQGPALTDVRAPDPDIIRLGWRDRRRGNSIRQGNLEGQHCRGFFCLPLFFWADSSSQRQLYLYCSFAKILFMCTMFTFTSSPVKTAANSGRNSGSDGQDVANTSPDQMRALLAQQHAALATLLTKPDELSVTKRQECGS